MDSFEGAIREDIICLGGEKGVTIEKLWEIVDGALKKTLGIDTLNEASKQLIWEQIIAASGYQLVFASASTCDSADRPMTALPSDTRIVAPCEERLLFYTAGKPLRLTDVQLRALEVIARSQRRGVTQAEAAKQLSLDARSFFHQLKALLEYGLISKIPVSQQRTFTYLLHLARYAEFEGETGENLGALTTTKRAEASSSPLFVPSASTIRARIMEILQSAPQKTLSASEIYRLVQADPKAVKVYRKHIAWLVTHGHIECFVAEELGGVMGKILRWKRPLTESNSSKSIGKGSVSPKEAECVRLASTCSALVKAVALERQVHDYIDASGPKGVTLTQVMTGFGLNRKLGYRIGDRLTNGKVWGDSDIVKMAEFYGKERRHRYFTRQGQRRQLSTGAEGDEGGSQPGHQYDDVQIISSTPGAGAARDSINRTRRLHVLKGLLDELRMVEVGKQLAVELQRRLAEHEFTMDTKTLKRLITLLEQSGDCQTIVVALPTGGSRTILLHQNLSLSDTSVQAYIESVKRSKVELSSGQRIETELKEETFAEPQEGFSRSASSSALSSSKSHKYQMQKHGFIHGIMARCRLLHRYLLTIVCTADEEEWRPCETLPWLFRNLPFDLFLKLVGLAEMSPHLTSFMTSARPAEITMDSLPKDIRQEVHRRRVDAHKRTIKRLMECLCQLGLATVDNRYPSVAFRLPYQYRIARHATIFDVRAGQPKESVDLTQEGNFERYWRWLEGLCSIDNSNGVETEVGQAQVSYETGAASDISPSLPSIYRNLVSIKESWQVASSNRRLLRKALRELIRQQDELDIEQRQSLQSSQGLTRELAELQADYEIGSLESVQAEYVALLAERTERRARRQQNRQQRQRIRRHLRPRPPGDEHQSDEHGDYVEPDHDSLFSDARRSTKALLSDVDMRMLRLATALLHRPNLRSGPGNLQWSLVESLSHPRTHMLPAALGEEVRALVTRLALSYDQHAKQMMALERELAFLEAAICAGYLDPEPRATDTATQEEYFVTLVQFYADLLNRLSDIKEQICKLGKGKMPSEDEGVLVKFDLLQSMQAIPWQRMSRLQQQHYFADLPPYQSQVEEGWRPTTFTAPIPSNSSLSLSWSPYEAEVAALKRTLIAPAPGKYEPEAAHAHLTTMDPTRLEAALGLLLENRLMARGASAHYVQRPLGGEYSVHERFIQIIDGIDGWDPAEGNINKSSEVLLGTEERSLIAFGDQSSSLVQKLKAISKGLAQVDFSGTDELKITTVAEPTRIHERFENTLALTSSNSQSPFGDSTMVWNLSSQRLSVLRAACKFVYEAIGGSPTGIVSIKQLNKTCWPFLTPSEVQVALTILQDADLIEGEAGTSFIALK